jgi:hypothetical protein
LTNYIAIETKTTTNYNEFVSHFRFIHILDCTSLVGLKKTIKYEEVCRNDKEKDFMKNKKEDKYHEYIELIHQNTLIKDDKRLKECLKGKTKISECFFLAILDR